MIANALIGLVYLASFLFVFSIIVVFHELGHFWAGRACGVRVETFSIGFGRTLASWTDRHGTVWRIAALPLGGYVRFFGDASAASNPDRETLDALRAELDAEHGAGAAESCFHFKPVWQRAIVIAAGPAANFVLAFAIFTALTLAFGEQGVRPVVSGVVAESPAEAAGFEAGDVIVSIEGRPIRYFRQIRQHVALATGESVDFVVDRDGTEVALTARIVREAVTDPFGNEARIGFLGVSVVPAEAGMVSERFGLLGALGRGGTLTWEALEAPVRYFARLVTLRESPDGLRSFLGIGQISGDAARQSFENGAESGGVVGGVGNALVTLVTLAALLSVVMGFLNLMPIPVLDGGHLVYYAYEAVRGRPLGEGAQEWGFRIGLALVLGLMVFATWNDLRLGGVFERIGALLS